MRAKLEVVPPYSYGNENFEVLSVIDELARVRIAEMISGDQEAFALLFSAAPDLLEALAEIKRNCEPWKTADNMAGRLWDIAGRAIRKTQKEEWD